MLSGLTVGNAIVIVADLTSFEDIQQQAIAMGFSVSDKKTAIERLQGVTKSEKLNRGDNCGDTISLQAFFSLLTPEISTLVLSMSDLSSISVFKQKTTPRKTKIRPINELERESIITALEANEWCCKTTARLLGIDRSTLYRKMKKYSIAK